jgi:hypothetical protein
VRDRNASGSRTVRAPAPKRGERAPSVDEPERPRAAVMAIPLSRIARSEQRDRFQDVRDVEWRAVFD